MTTLIKDINAGLTYINILLQITYGIKDVYMKKDLTMSLMLYVLKVMHLTS